MPAIFKNNKNYGGNSPLIINDESYSTERVWSSDKVNSELLKLSNELKKLIGEEDKVEITYEEYSDLSEEEKLNGKVYYITDKSIVAFKGVEYGGDVKVKELTAAEYEALSEEEQKNGTIYFVTDVDENGDITGYTGGTGIEIGSDKVIKVTDEISNEIITTFGCQIYANENGYTVSANTSKTVVSNIDWKTLFPNLYTDYPDLIPFMIIPWYCNSGMVFVNLGLNNSGGIFCNIRNTSDTDITIEAGKVITGFKMLCTKNPKTYTTYTYTLPVE